MIKQLFIKEDETIKKAMNVMDGNGFGIVLIVDDQKMLRGIVTDGDIKRALFKGVDKNSSIREIMSRNPIIIEKGFKKSNAEREILRQVEERGLVFSIGDDLKVPVIYKNRKVVGLMVFNFNSNTLSSLPKKIKTSKGLVKKVLVVGGAGYLGSVLCRQLLTRGYFVKVLDTLNFGDKPLREFKNNKKLELIVGDVRDATVLVKILRDVDAVIHLAAIVGDPASMKNPEDTISTNYLATMNLAQACKYYQINRFIYASTCSVYGLGSHELDENALLNPVSLYARSKIESEKGILSLADENFSPVIFRMATLFGLSPRMRFDLVVNTFAKMATMDGKITIFGGDQWRPLLHTEDAAKAYLSCLEIPIANLSSIYNVGSNRHNHQIKEIGQMVKKIFPKVKVEIKLNEDINGHEDKRDYKVVFDKIEKELDFVAKKSVEDGLIEINKTIKRGIIRDPNLSIYYNS